MLSRRPLLSVALSAAIGLTASTTHLTAEEAGPALTGFDKTYMVDAERRLGEAETKVAAGPKSVYAAESALKNGKRALEKFIARRESHASHPRAVAAQAKIVELEAAVQALKDGRKPAMKPASTTSTAPKPTPAASSKSQPAAAAKTEPAANPNMNKANGGLSGYYREKIENGLKNAEYNLSRNFRSRRKRLMMKLSHYGISASAVKISTSIIPT